MMNHFQSDRLAAQHRQQLELETARARLAHEAVADATDATHDLLGSLGSRALAPAHLLPALVSRRRMRPGNAPIVS
jgi:hypothetical protein